MAIPSIKDVPPEVRDLYAVYCFKYLTADFSDRKMISGLENKMDNLEEKYPALKKWIE